MTSIFNNETISGNFGLCVRGYHMLNTDPIKEAVWEQINVQVFKHSGIEVIGQACGSHSSGCDIETTSGRFSNKSAKYEKTGFSISSYRLTAVTNSENPGTPEEISDEINKRKNFNYYSVILREELDKGGFKYDWYMIPSDHPNFDPCVGSWIPTMGKRGKNAGKQIGWEKSDGSMKISFSMSSQLWIYLKAVEEMKQFIIASTIYDGKLPEMDYIGLAKATIG
jgi:hypothetical protein